MSRLNLTPGQKFNMLTYRYGCLPNKHAHPRGVFSCDCGVGETVKELSAVVNGHTQSCGCLHLKKIARGNPKHECYGTTEYHSWAGMIQRCHNPAADTYKNYGARGITVCERWRKDFRNFLNDMGKCPVGHSIERKSNGGGYFRENCCWATRKEQSRNTRRTRKFTINGQTKCFSDWCDTVGVNRGTAWSRLDRGLTIEEALRV